MKDFDASAMPILAYKDEHFADSEEARPLRILAEYLAPLRAFNQQRVQDTVVFFRLGPHRRRCPLGRYYDEARELARLITTWSMAREGLEHRHIVCSAADQESWRRPTAGPWKRAAGPSA